MPFYRTKWTSLLSGAVLLWISRNGGVTTTWWRCGQSPGYPSPMPEAPSVCPWNPWILDARFPTGTEMFYNSHGSAWNLKRIPKNSVSRIKRRGEPNQNLSTSSWSGLPNNVLDSRCVVPFLNEGDSDMQLGVGPLFTYCEN